MFEHRPVIHTSRVATYAAWEGSKLLNKVGKERGKGVKIGSLEGAEHKDPCPTASYTHVSVSTGYKVKMSWRGARGRGNTCDHVV